jgi:hypothetical protein
MIEFFKLALPAINASVFYTISPPKRLVQSNGLKTGLRDYPTIHDRSPCHPTAWAKIANERFN